jgi:hypothetical protein
MKIGKYYKARVQGWDCVIEYTASGYSPHHCKTCTCINDKAIITVVSENKDMVPIGLVSDVQIFEELENYSVPK